MIEVVDEMTGSGCKVAGGTVVADFLHAIYVNRVGFALLPNMACDMDGECYSSLHYGARYCIGDESPISYSWGGNCMMTNTTCECVLDFLPVLENLPDYIDDAYVKMVDGGGDIMIMTRNARDMCMCDAFTS